VDHRNGRWDRSPRPLAQLDLPCRRSGLLPCAGDLAVMRAVDVGTAGEA